MSPHALNPMRRCVTCSAAGGNLVAMITSNSASHPLCESTRVTIVALDAPRETAPTVRAMVWARLRCQLLPLQATVIAVLPALPRSVTCGGRCQVVDLMFSATSPQQVRDNPTRGASVLTGRSPACMCCIHFLIKALKRDIRSSSSAGEVGCHTHAPRASILLHVSCLAPF